MFDSELAKQIYVARKRFLFEKGAVDQELDKGNAHPLWTDGFAEKAAGSFQEKDGVYKGAFTITTPTVDSYGDVVISTGGNYERYRKNPVVLRNHNYWDYPVGKSLNEIVTEDSVKSEMEFAVGLLVGGVDHALSCFNFYKSQFLNACSIGFIPKKWEKRLVTDSDGEEIWKGGWIILEWELLEYSLVTVPANEDALGLDADIEAVKEFDETKLRSIVREILQKESPGMLRGFVEHEVEQVLAESQLQQPGEVESEGLSDAVERALDGLLATASSTN